MTLAATTYSANRGYAWSSVPDGLTRETLDGFCRVLTSSCGEFRQALSVNVGLVSDGRLAAVCTRQNVPNWDSAGRASDYIALALFPVALGSLFDFVDLLNSDFFWMPTKTPPHSIDYTGHASAPCPADFTETLRRTGKGTLADPHALGALIAALGSSGGSWLAQLREAEQAIDLVRTSGNTSI